jgi:ubiquinone biosynthesis protein
VLARMGKDGAEICIVDFGQVKILSPQFHEALTKSVMCFITRDVDGFLDTLVSLGLFTTERVEEVRPAAHKTLERYGSMTPDEVGKMDFEWIRKELVTELTTLRGIVVPQELVLYGRTLALLAGLTRQIDPTVDAFALARPFILEAMLARP